LKKGAGRLSCSVRGPEVQEKKIEEGNFEFTANNKCDAILKRSHDPVGNHPPKKTEAAQNKKVSGRRNGSRPTRGGLIKKEGLGLGQGSVRRGKCSRRGDRRTLRGEAIFGEKRGEKKGRFQKN